LIDFVFLLTAHTFSHLPPQCPLSLSLSLSHPSPLFFSLADYIPRFREAEAVLSQWISEGKIKAETHIYNGGEGGIEAAPAAIIGLFEGQNTGKVSMLISWLLKTIGACISDFPSLLGLFFARRWLLSSEMASPSLLFNSL